jgi:hypothetical protein
MPWHNIASRATNYKVTAANWNEMVDNMDFLAETGYAEFTANASITTTTVGTATQVVTLGALTYEAVPYMIEFFCGRVNAGANACNIILRDGTTVLGTLAQLASSTNNGAVYLTRRLTPTAGSHSYNVAAWNGGAATATFLAGTGGTAGDNTTYLPGWIRAQALPT